MKNFRTFFLVFFVILAISNCSKQKSPLEKAKDIGTIEAFENFISENPESEFIIEAQMTLDSLRFEKISKSDSIETFESLIANYPQSRFIQQAKDSIMSIHFHEAQSTNTILAYETFIEKYPNSKYVKRIEIILDSLRYVQLQKDGRLKEYRNFIKKYPNSRFSKQVLQKIENLSFLIVDIKPTKTGHKNKAIIRRDKSGILSFYRKDEPGYYIAAHGGRLKSIHNASVVIGNEGEWISSGELCIELDDDNEFFGSLDYEGSIYTFENTVKFLGFTFMSDSNDPLVFELVKGQGFDYISGKGTVITKEGKKVNLGIK